MKRYLVKLVPMVAALALLLPASSSGAAGAPGVAGSLAIQQPARRIVHLRPQGHPPLGADPRAAGRAFGKGNLLWGRGPVQHAPASYVIFWGAGWQTTTGAPTAPAKVIEKYFADLAGTAFERILTQYHDGSAHVSNVHALAAAAFDPATPPSDSSCGGPTIQDSSIQREVVDVAKKLNWPTNDPNATFYVYTPSGDNVNDGAGDCSNTAFCAYHTWSTTTPGFAYALLAYPFDSGCRVPKAPNRNLDGDSLVSMTSHEQFEAITDPQAGNGWIDAANYEIGDKCFWDFSRGYTRLAHGGRFEVQTEFSNASRSCVNSYAPRRPRRAR